MQSVQQMTLQSNAQIVNKYGDWLDAQNKSHSTRNTMKCFAGRLLMKFNADWLVNHEECEIITQIGIPQPIKRNMFNVYSHYTRVFKEFLQQELS